MVSFAQIHLSSFCEAEAVCAEKLFDVIFVGMTSAAFTIIWMGILLEWRTILVGSAGAAIGCVFGMYHVDQLFTGMN